MNRPNIVKTSWPYFQKLLQYHGLEYYPTTERPNWWSGNQQKIKGFSEYNNLLNINITLAANLRPSNDIADRTLKTRMPFRMHVARPWNPPTHHDLTINQCFELRAKEIANTDQKINLFWSGGIDSSAMVIAFLKTCPHGQLRIVHSAMSRKENPYLFLLLKQYPELELVDMGGEFYLTNTLDGICVQGQCGDDIFASLDESFYQELGYNTIHSSWRNYFYKKTQDVEFVNFCEEFFSRSQRPIDTLIEARWWFHTNCRFRDAFRSMVVQDPKIASTAFFYSKYFEDFMYYNTDKLLPGKEYSSYKQFIKNYANEFDKNPHYQTTKTKVNSGQLASYTNKKDCLLDTRRIMTLSDCTPVTVDSLPFLSEHDYRKKYGTSLNYLFEQDQV